MKFKFKEMIKTILILLFSVILLPFLKSQNACSTTGSLYGLATGNTRGYSLASAGNDGFYVAGLKSDSMLLLKVTLKGKIEWARTFDIVPNKVEQVSAIIVDSDGMIAMAGLAGTLGFGGTVFTFRYNPNINQVLWAKEYISSTRNLCYTLIQKGPGGNYVISNNPHDDVNSNNDCELFEIDKNTGSVVSAFAKNYDLGGSDGMADLLFYNGFIYGSGRYTDGGTLADMRNTLIKVSATTGDVTWVRMGHIPANTSARLYGWDLVIDQDVIYSGCYGDPGGTSSTNTKLYIQKTSLNGELIWIKQYDLPGANDAGYEIIKSENGIVVLAGKKASPGELILFKIDLEGNVLWARSFKFPSYITLMGDLDSRVSQLIQVGGKLIFTAYASNQEGGTNLILVRTDLNGVVDIPCVENTSISIPIVAVTNPVFYSVNPTVFSVTPGVNTKSISADSSSLAPRNECLVIDTLTAFVKISICQGQEYEGYSASGTYTDYFKTNMGCDSVRTLHLLVVTPAINPTIIKNICEGEMYEGYFFSGIFRDTFTAVSGCDSVRTLLLNVLPPTVATIDQSICSGDMFEGYSASGIYRDTFTSFSGCDSIRILQLNVLLPTITAIKKEICAEEFFEGFNQTGVYRDTFELSSGCDSIRTLYLTVLACDPVVTYDLDDCKSNMLDGSNMDYMEFTPQYPTALPCGSFTGTALQRAVFPDNKHSCTPGVNGSIGMCVNSLSSCTYVPGHPVSVFFEIAVNPESDSTVAFNKLEFYAKGPANYVWVNGPTGVNNYPRFYGIRILKNNMEIYQKRDIPTSLTWTLQSFNFNDLEEFKMTTPSTFRIELLPYCPVNNGADVSAWDLDEIKIFGSCLNLNASDAIVQGHVLTWNGNPVQGAQLNLENNKTSTTFSSVTAGDGSYVFDKLQRNTTYSIQGNRNNDLLEGVSTLDLIRIQKHLLGIAPFTSLDQFVAADINKSGTITVLDLIDLRKALLGIYSQFPDNTSWRLGVMPMDMNSHRLTDFIKKQTFESLYQFQTNVDFMGIKIGDVNHDRLPGIISNHNIQPRIDEASVLYAENVAVHKNESVTINIYAGDTGAAEGIQFALKLKDLSFLKMEGAKIPISTDNYSYAENGLIKVSWSQVQDLNFSKGDILFSLTFIPANSGYLNEKMQLATNQFPSEIYSGDKAIPLEFEFHEIEEHQKPNLVYVEINPNPFSTSTQIAFQLLQKDLVRISFFNTSGQLLSSKEEMYSPGRHVFITGSEFLPAADLVFYCQVVCNSQVITKKVIRIR